MEVLQRLNWRFFDGIDRGMVAATKSVKPKVRLGCGGLRGSGGVDLDGYGDWCLDLCVGFGAAGVEVAGVGFLDRCVRLFLWKIKKIIKIF